MSWFGDGSSLKVDKAHLSSAPLGLQYFGALALCSFLGAGVESLAGTHLTRSCSKMGKGSRWFEDWRCTRGTPLPDQPLLYVVVLGLHPHPPFACISLPMPPNFDPP